jgi:predicted nucleotidyltransferase
MDNIEHIKKVTLYRDINEVLYFLAGGIQKIFGADLVGFYLTGSLSYGDFDEERSDIDLAVVLKKPASNENIEAVERLHLSVENICEKWAKRIECSYVPRNMLKNVLPPKDSRPYVGGGLFYKEATYGNEWIINNFLLSKYGIALIGPDFKTLIEPIKMIDVQKAHVRDLHKEWEPKISDSTYLENSHYQSYLVLNLCRLIYNIIRGDIASKKVAAAWVKKEYPQWKDLIETADRWHYGVKMERQIETVEFVKFVIAKVKEQNIPNAPEK